MRIWECLQCQTQGKRYILKVKKRGLSFTIYECPNCHKQTQKETIKELD